MELILGKDLLDLKKSVVTAFIIVIVLNMISNARTLYITSFIIVMFIIIENIRMDIIVGYKLYRSMGVTTRKILNSKYLCSYIIFFLYLSIDLFLNFYGNKNLDIRFLSFTILLYSILVAGIISLSYSFLYRNKVGILIMIELLVGTISIYYLYRNVNIYNSISILMSLVISLVSISISYELGVKVVEEGQN